ncbi:MAG: TatD family hydrolase [Candidatus Pacebacteria bacterium]|nr:TatD family hydrolase [Candidatus Paceibacterota bacterium]
MEIKYIDIHSHFNLPQFDADLSAAIKKMEDEGVATFCVGTDLTTSRRAIEIAAMSPNIWAVVGQHPTDTDEAFDPAAFLELAKHEKVVAIGECGFDFFHTPRADVFEKQKELFLQQIELARSVNKPLMIHARPSKGTISDENGVEKSSMDAYEDTLNILSNFPEVRANFHFFVGDNAIAKRAHVAGHTMSYDGPITFTHEYDETIQSLPLSAIMAETDSPFAAPEPYRTNAKKEGMAKGDRRPAPARAEPWMVKEVVSAIATIRGEDHETVRLATLDNAKQFFKILL